MKLDYFSLINPLPFYVNGVGSIKSPTLREISKINYYTYQVYLSNLLLDPDSYYEMIDKTEGAYLCNFTEQEKDIILRIRSEYMNLDEKSKEDISIYNIMVFDKFLIDSLLCTLNFFFEDEIIYDTKKRVFILFNGTVDDNNRKTPTGMIHKNNYNEIIDIILQRVNVDKKKDEHKNLKVKNKTAEKLLKKMKKAKKETEKKEDKKMEIGNLISSISAHSKTLNILNIWDLTIFQLYDQFARMRNDDLYMINSTSVSVWGDKENKFDDTIWFSIINKD